MNIYLIGYRGSGKTTIGKKISKSLKFVFSDTDELIVQNEKRSIPEIFATSGEQYFREKESEILRRVAFINRTVVATGGGIILSEANRALIKKTGFCVYLKAGNKILSSRIEGDDNRPPLTGLSLSAEIENVLRTRAPLYEITADMTVDTGSLSPENCSEIIIDSFTKWRRRT